jgi:predicted small integral membrane protein
MVVTILFAAIAFNNLIDPETNFSFVQHVMSMDLLPAQHPLRWRAVTSTWIQQAAYGLIVACELFLFAINALAGIRLTLNRALPTYGFRQAQRLALTGLTLAFVFLVLVFVAGASEWFLVWQIRSPSFDGSMPSVTRLILICGIALLVVAR